MSTLQDITVGVPQGSLLGPRLFSIFTTDLPISVKSGYVHMYANDTTVFCVGDCVDSVCFKLQSAMEEIYAWCFKHRLTIHPEKSKALILNRGKFVGPLQPLKVSDDYIEYVDKCECLGIILDNKLSWRPHVERVSKRFAAKVKKLRNLSYLQANFLEDIYTKQ